MVAFEPHPENYGVTVQALLGALPQTDLHCIQIYAAALGAESGQGLLFGDGAAASFFRQNADIYAARSTQGQAHARRHGGMLEYEGDLDLPPHVDVPMQTLDGFCAERQIEEVSLLKLDVEGAEPTVLVGARELLRARRIHVALLEYSYLWNVAFMKMMIDGGTTPAPQHMLAWPTLEAVVREVDAYGYNTYFDRGDAFLLLTGEKWHDVYEVCRDPMGAHYRMPYEGWCIFAVAIVRRGPFADSLPLVE